MWCVFGKFLKTLTRTVVECYANRFARRALRDIEDAYRIMIVEMIEYALKMMHPRAHCIKCFTGSSGRAIHGYQQGRL